MSYEANIQHYRNAIQLMQVCIKWYFKHALQLPRVGGSEILDIYILLLNRLCFHPESFSNQNFNSFEMFGYETEFDESWFDESQDIFHIENTINVTEVT